MILKQEVRRLSHAAAVKPARALTHMEWKWAPACISYLERDFWFQSNARDVCENWHIRRFECSEFIIRGGCAQRSCRCTRRALLRVFILTWADQMWWFVMDWRLKESHKKELLHWCRREHNLSCVLLVLLVYFKFAPCGKRTCVNIIKTRR